MTKKSKAKQTFMVMVLDKSGSMYNTRKDTIGSFNQQLTAAQESSSRDHKIYMTLILFNETAEVVYRQVDVNELNEIDDKVYRPNGGTALYDAMDLGISELTVQMTGCGSEDAAIMFTITDGEENSSRHVTSSELIKQKIKALEDTERYTFTYVGTESIDKATQNFGISAGNAFVWNGAKSVGTMSVGATQNYFSMRSMGATYSAGLYDTTKSQKELEELAKNLTGEIKQTIVFNPK